MSATHNSITVIHANPQPNLSVLSYFAFDQNNPSPMHPLHTHLKTISWLQLLSPAEEATYREPSPVPDTVLATYKSGKRGAYYRKRRRWARVKAAVDEARGGGFAGLVVASVMAPVTVLHHTVPLLRGGAQVVVYSANIEPLVELADYYSMSRRAAFLSAAERPVVPSEEFPVDPTLLLTPMVLTARARPWQVLPGRTHPKMTGKGGADGYIFTATRVLPAEGVVAARGSYKRRKVVVQVGSVQTSTEMDTSVDGASREQVVVEPKGSNSKEDESGSIEAHIREETIS